ncbi:formyltetrahydrofolate deformylase [Gloeomargarita lithophora Alchichica-D10]|uniref:Formyltetrahydrofolate deformylase n=1 Tax=Gloeomargarita lithophora Alchichica-D10 TaxID=1188229 RepID=A0A1J0ABJ7_9CYAN|nr:formyltetrahydrofolate deformylase [Gloeomargarita lithophora]APB33307.1 formyltetrahydrofolate deformylase [Gloeomargarita lithophora Alchichica-D10]
MHGILQVCCPDQRGLVAKISQFVHQWGGNIIHADHHLDEGLFLSRLEWELAGFQLSPSATRTEFTPIAQSISAQWSYHTRNESPKLAIFVGKQSHCLWDLLWRQRAGELPGEITLIISNHQDCAPIAEQFQIPFYYITITNKSQVEAEQLKLIKTHDIQLIVLAKYMQILSQDFIDQCPPMINIHHSFLPAFPGANPYHRAHQRGVKIIGATAHYVTPDLDAGPIIEQDIVRVSHRHTVADLVRQGRDVERRVLAQAVRWHLEHRVLVYHNKTVVFT